MSMTCNNAVYTEQFYWQTPMFHKQNAVRSHNYVTFASKLVEVAMVAQRLLQLSSFSFSFG
jgi:hypothetical protein